MNIRAVLFDWDGTVVDSIPAITKHVQVALRAFDVHNVGPERIRRLVGVPLAALFSELGIAPEDVSCCIDIYRSSLFSAGCEDTYLYDGASECIMKLSQDGVLIGVASSKSTIRLEEEANHFGLRKYVSVISGVDDDDTKNKAQIIESAMEHLCVMSDESVMVGDRAFDILGAHTNDMRSIAVTWGCAQGNELNEANPTRTVHSYEALYNALIEL